ncbi:5-(carboxyamino)imidazole ribonucleotide synthase [Saccharobesus litoralis]|uniref:N5-carboxyaminoimidazole ribonucleotide synthase n=1 Tax=Saccharobesus litoralis TaxID=2172099 RepID=A0A2S0VQW3_9ALTE|nr:5-(carboxyamino)imidazole ribonucleotide synthase [Saccharobesus litoralis]AWB66606.1 5-(carboxyamino)imidazole ribonucleotide synthase [Saccharobesus litoralis]
MMIVVLGSGQLAQMMYLAGTPLGLKVVAVDPVANTVVHPVEKNPLPLSVSDAFAQANAITAEFEHLSAEILEQANATGKLYPSVEAIQTGGDRIKEKNLLDSLGIDNCAYHAIYQVEQLDKAFADIGPELIVKTSKDGYDGYGQFRINNAADLADVKAQLAQHDFARNPLIAEQKSKFDREVSIVGARNGRGEIVCYPLAENLHYQGQLRVSLAPAPRVSEAVQQQAETAFKALANKLDYRGVLAIEFFQVGEKLLVNEIAPRVHNSGHWTMQGTSFCQFENHLRAVVDLPLGTTDTPGVTTMINLIGCEKTIGLQVADLGGHLHWYGKDVRAKRKVGHVNFTANTVAESIERLKAVQALNQPDMFPLIDDVIADLS